MTATRHYSIFFLVATSIVGFTKSLARPNTNALLKPRTTTTTITTALLARRPRDPNWEDDTKSSRNNPDVTDYLPPWRDHEGQRAFSGSQATPGEKNRPFKAFSGSANANTTPQESVSMSPGAPQNLIAQQQQQQQLPPAQQQAPVRQAVGALRGGSSSTGILLHNIKWPLIRDPPGVSSEFPLLVTRIAVTMISTIATWYLHLFNGYSPVLASSAMTLLVSTCLDRRLGQAAFCGSFAGMCGGHLAPDVPMAVLLGALTSLSYEVLIHINNFCLGIGGRLGATAFLATSVLAKYQGVASVGRKMRRGLWKSGAGPSSIVVVMMLYHVLGSVSTIFLRECSDDSAAADPVRASSVIGLLGSLFLKDPTAILALYGGSFVGMSLPSRLLYGNAPGSAKMGQPQSAMTLFGSFAVAGAISGLIHAITLHNGYWGGGWGGKAGLCAFAGCWVYRGFGNVFDFLRRKK
mmetsp:Transcript_10433/g.22694  ORF Transcript_10433/g.22694 Transcript_10433/m.22694 type:complete len:464 (+) Transcript_10433:34-1425(+)